MIFPLSGSDQLAVEPAGHLVNGCRLAPPESSLSGRNGSWQLWLQKRHFLESERKRRLLHENNDQKMNPECTIFPYDKK